MLYVGVTKLRDPPCRCLVSRLDRQQRKAGAAWEFISWATPVPGWSHDQMPVIGHQAIRKQFELRTFECFEQNTLEGYVVFRLVKDSGTTIRSIEHVVDRTTSSDRFGLPMLPSLRGTNVTSQ